jgi:signal transduction histidine kinase
VVARRTVIVAGEGPRVVGWKMDSLSTLGLTTSAAGGATVLFMRASRPRRSDLLLPALIGLVGVVEIAAAGYSPVWLALATYLLAAAVLCAGRFAPLAVPLLVTAIYALTPLLGVDVAEPASWVPLIAFACLSTGLHAPRSRKLAGLASVLGALAILLAGLKWLADFEPSLLFGLIMTVGAWVLGLALREALDQNRRAGAEAERARVGRALAGKRAAEAERDRIAGELHDVLAHSLGAMVVQSSVAGDLVRTDRAAAATALGDVAEAGREAIAETGRLLRLLRDDRDEPGLHGGTATEALAQTTSGAVVAAPVIPIRDVLLPVLFGVIGTAEIVSNGFGPLWASLGAYWLAVGILCGRRALPLAMPIAVTAVFVGARVVDVDTVEPASWILTGALAYFSAGRHVPRSRMAWGLASVLASIGLWALDAARGERTADAVLVLAGAMGPWVVGVALRETLERTRALAAEAERARLEQELEAERAAAAERKRIARELHDVLANSLIVMIMQASLAADLVVRDPLGASGAVSEVERSGRTALGEIGRLLRLIRDDANEAGTHPQHGVADIPALAEEYARAGLGIDLDVDDVARLPIGVDLSTYRIVQEGLTNALKHAPGSPVCVRLVRRESGVAIEVRNGPAAPGTAVAAPSGHGLVGLRERVSLFGGQLDARPTGDGGFVLAATIPVVSEVA